jgi:signal transduction histidine kinase
MSESDRAGADGRRLPWPRRTVRLRFTLLYGGLFLLCGAALLAVTYVLVGHALAGPVRLSVPPGTGGAGGAGGAGGLPSTSISAGSAAPGGAAQTCTAVFVGSGPPATPAAECTLLERTLRQQRHDELEQLLVGCGIALGIMTVAAVGLGWLMAGKVLRPLRAITTAAQRISASNLHQRLALAGPDDELRELGKTVNDLLGRLEGSFRAQRQFVANASHELRTPLARQRTLVEVALADPQRSAQTLQAACERVLAAGEQQERLIESLLTLARSQRGLDERQPADLKAVAGEVLTGHEPEAARRGLRVSATLRDAPASGDPRLLERLAVNLVDNALRHNVPGGWVQVITGIQAGRPVLTVVNSGPPVRADDISRLFDPFQRPGPERAGTRDGHGLGLSIVAAIAAAHDAQLIARALPAGGLEVEVRFPPRPGAPPPGRAGAVRLARAAAP